MSPLHSKILWQVLRDSILAYEEQFGVIPEHESSSWCWEDERAGAEMAERHHFKGPFRIQNVVDVADVNDA
jgi:hypothetical protein